MSQCWPLMSRPLTEMKSSLADLYKSVEPGDRKPVFVTGSQVISPSLHQLKRSSEEGMNRPAENWKCWWKLSPSSLRINHIEK